MIKKHKKENQLRTIDDFIYSVGNAQDVSKTEEHNPIEYEFISDTSELEDNKIDIAEQVEITNQAYINNSPSMDDDFLGGFNTTLSILESEDFIKLPEEDSSSKKELPDIESFTLKIK